MPAGGMPAAGISEGTAWGGMPSEEELAAIVAAIEIAWPRTPVGAVAGTDDRAGADSAWHWSGRWWLGGALAKRRLPWAQR